MGCLYFKKWRSSELGLQWCWRVPTGLAPGIGASWRLLWVACVGGMAYLGVSAASRNLLILHIKPADKMNYCRNEIHRTRSYSIMSFISV